MRGAFVGYSYVIAGRAGSFGGAAVFLAVRWASDLRRSSAERSASSFSWRASSACSFSFRFVRLPACRSCSSVLGTLGGCFAARFDTRDFSSFRLPLEKLAAVSLKELKRLVVRGEVGGVLPVRALRFTPGPGGGRGGGRRRLPAGGRAAARLSCGV